MTGTMQKPPLLGRQAVSAEGKAFRGSVPQERMGVMREDEIRESVANIIGANEKLYAENQRLRNSAQLLHETINTYLLGDCDKTTLIKAQSQLVNILEAPWEATPCTPS